MDRERLVRMASWNPPDSWMRIVTVEAHTAGEPLRVFVSGYPTIAGDSVLDRRRFMLENHDEIRRALMWEPRGHADMYGCIVVPPERPDSDFGVLFTHNEGYSTMCGHGIIAITKVVVEMGIVDRTGSETTVRIDTPAGLVVATALSKGDTVDSVSFVNVPSFVDALDESVDVEGHGQVRYDLAFGGAYYAFVDAQSVGLECTPRDVAQLVDLGRRIKKSVASARTIVHPEEGDLGFLYGTIFTGPAAESANHSRHVCVFADGEVDRSPTGTGVSARAAILLARGELQPGEEIQIESILGTTFAVRSTVAAPNGVGAFDAIVPVVSGRAFITGRTEHWIDPEDPLAFGFMLR